MNTEKASCYCGNIQAELELPKELSAYTPRACDCDFCVKNGAAYISDPAGSVKLRVKNSEDATLYKQGSKLVDLLICKNCGVLVAVMYSDDEALLGGLNSITLDNRELLAATQSASPKLLSSAEKIKRWKEIWFQNVIFEQERE